MELLMKIRWRPEIGDPSFMGWFTVVAYFAAALLAWRAWAVEKDKLWLGVTVLMACLCLNKQFDLQSLFTDIGREFARHGGWYENRRAIQKVFVFAVLAGSGLFGCWFVWRFHAYLWGHRLLSAGLLFLLTFIVVRAISFHHVDVFLKSRVAGARMNWILELGGITLVAWAALKELPVADRPRRSAGDGLR